MKTIDTYLSVDLDYWGYFKKFHKQSLRNLMNKIVLYDIPVKVVVSHEDILYYINRYKIKNLINIDYHADIVNQDSDSDHIELCDGTWANFYKYKEDCNFIWYHTFEMWEGRCDNTLAITWEDIPTGYKQLSHYYTLRSFSRYINWYNIKEVCFAISPDYLSSNMSWLTKEYDYFVGYEPHFII